MKRSLLDIVRTDNTFQKVRTREGSEVWEGKCIHCNRKLVVELDGRAAKSVTVEHIVPQTSGGGDDLANLALACARCNHQKGRHHDVKGLADPRAAELVDALLEKRRKRWRNMV